MHQLSGSIMSRVAIAAFTLLGLSQIWTTSKLEKVEDRLAIVTKLLEDSYLAEAHKACRQNEDGKTFPKPNSKRNMHYLDAMHHKELGGILSSFYLEKIRWSNIDKRSQLPVAGSCQSRRLYQLVIGQLGIFALYFR